MAKGKKVMAQKSEVVSSDSEGSTYVGSPLTSESRNSSVGEDLSSKGNAPIVYDKNLWYIHGNSYDLSGFVDKHPGGRMALLTGRGRDCTALFESYHPWNDKHRKVLGAYGAKPPPPDPFYEEICQGVRKAYPEGLGSTKMRTHTFITLSALWCVMMYLFFVVRTTWSSLLAGMIMATVGTRLAHEGGHWQVSSKEWVNRASLFLGYFLVGPSNCWYYQHVISHHVDTNQDHSDREHDVDVEYIWIADKLPGWLKVLSLPGMFVGVLVEIGMKRLFIDILLRRAVGGHKVDWRLGGIKYEIPIWLAFHYMFGPPLMCYIAMYFSSGAIFTPMSQIAHVIVFPDNKKHESWARMQIAESVDFASESDFWYHFAMGLTTQVEHHLFPGIGHHCYDTVRKITREVCKKHGVTHMDVSAKKALGALWYRFVQGQPLAALA
eukprot:TRINITY_DN38716_c0_g1_i1.p1 TRINITY_DN38716_c0_g1~~TRINITY_DN38716_c0_g1_i1.p1  ORF type:complete len:436 (+),score=80.17 TRINITY_DN38716_c0_g1_i1:73-1380(+)